MAGDETTSPSVGTRQARPASAGPPPWYMPDRAGSPRNMAGAAGASGASVASRSIGGVGTWRGPAARPYAVVPPTARTAAVQRRERRAEIIDDTDTGCTSRSQVARGGISARLVRRRQGGEVGGAGSLWRIGRLLGRVGRRRGGLALTWDALQSPSTSTEALG